MTSGEAPARPDEERIERLCDVLFEAFGDRAVTVAERQMAAASDDARSTWLAIARRLREGGGFDPVP